jgi:2,3-bisphosphoglycerate-dependent phosphoglycerate mutase
MAADGTATEQSHDPQDAVPPVTRLIVIRHGESKVTVRRVIGGFRTCDGLSPLGTEQAQRLANRLGETREIAADVVISSDFARARETAEAIVHALAAPGLGSPTLDIDPAFGEHDPGPEIDGMTFQDYVDRFGMPDWGGDPHTEIFPGGETMAEFHLRVGAALSKLTAQRSGSTIVLVCHGGVIDAIFRHLLGAPVTGRFQLQAANTSITEFVTTGTATTTFGHAREMWRLVRFNDAAHLAGLPVGTQRA